MLEWFELTNVEVKPKEKTATQDTESDESPVNHKIRSQMRVL